MSAGTKPGFVFTGRMALATIVGFFAVVISVNAVFITLAMQSFPGEDVRRSYLQGLHYNETLAERRAQAALGWRATAEIVREGDGASVTLVFRDAAGAPIPALSVTGEVRRPADAGEDQALAFVEEGGGRYVARTPSLRDGVWLLRAQAQEGGRLFRLENRLMLDPRP